MLRRTTNHLDRRQLLKLTGASAAAAALASQSRLTRAQDDAVTIRFFGPGDGVIFEPLFTGFTESTGIALEFDGVPFPDYQNTIVQRFGSGDTGIDAFLVDPTYIPIFTQDGYLMDITDTFADRVEGVIFETDIQGATYQGTMRSMPLWESTQLLYYNVNLLEAAGVEPPPADPEARWTWAQLLEAAQAAQAGGAPWGFNFEQVDRYYQLQVLPESLGGGPGVTGDDLLTVDVANDAWIQAGEWYGSLFSNGIAPVDPTNMEESTGLFLAGELAFYVAGPWNVPGFNAAEGLEYSIAPHPAFDGGAAVTPSESWHFGVSSDSENVDQALQLLEYSSLTTEGALLSGANGDLPANIEAAGEVLATSESSNPNLAGFADLVRYELSNTAIRRPRTLGYLQLEELVTRAWSDIRTGADAASTFESTQSELELTFERLAR